MEKTILKIVISLLMATAIISAGVGWDIYNDRQNVIEITNFIPLYSEAQPNLSIMKPEKIIGPGEKLKVLCIKYTKDFMIVKVETGDGTIGWVYDTDKIKLHRK